MAQSQVAGRIYYEVEPVAGNWSQKIKQQTRGTGTQVGQQFSQETNRSFNFTGAVKKIGSGIGGAFSKVGSIGLKAIGGVSTAIIGLAAHGGFKRAMDIEGAQAKLKGLGHSTKDIQTLMDNALGAVKGTAFGLGEAASVAAGMSAAGVKSGADMSKSLKTIADTAAIAGMSMSDTGLIFESIAGRGKLMGDDMRQLTSRGIPVLDILGKKLGKTSAEVSDMVSKGQIDFQTFQDAMSDALGGSAIAMGNTFEGKLKNLKAALGRLGETAATPILDLLKTQLDAVTPAIDTFASAIKPAVESLSKALKPYADAAANSIENFSKKLQDGQITLGDIATNIAKAAGAFELFKVMGGNMPAMFDGVLTASKTVGDALNGFTGKLSKLADPLGLLKQAGKSAGEGLTSVGNTLGNVKLLFNQSGRDLLQMDGAFGRIPADFQKIVDAGKSFAGWQPFQNIAGSKLVQGFQAKIAPVATRVKSLWDAQTLEMLKLDGDPFADFSVKVQAFNGKVQGVFQTIGGKIQQGLAPVKNAFGKVGDFMSPLTGAFGKIGGLVSDQMQALGGKVFPLVGQIFSPGKIMAAVGFGGIAAALVAGLGMLNQSMGDTLNTQVTLFFGNQLPGMLATANDFISSQLPGMIQDGIGLIGLVLDGITDNLPAAFQTLTDGLTTALNSLADGLPDLVSKGADLVTKLLEGITGALPSLVGSGIDIIGGLLEGLANALPNLVAAAPTIIMNLVNTLLQNIPKILDTATKILDSLVTGLLNSIPKLVAAVPQILQGLINTIVTNLPKIVDSGMNLLEHLVTGLMNAIPKLIAAVPQIIGGILGTLIRNFPKIVDAGSQILFRLLTGIIHVIGNIPGTVVQIFSSIKNTLTGYNWGEILINAGKAIIDGFINSVKAVWNNTKKFFSGIGDWIKQHKGPISYDKKLLVPAGQAIMGGFHKSLNAGWAGVQRDVNSWNAQLAGSFSPFNVNRLEAVNLQVQPTGMSELTQQVALLRFELPQIIEEYTPTIGRRDLARMVN